VRAGEIVGLIGPNGAGKSTTFNLVTGVLALTAGSVAYRGRSLHGLPSRRIAALGISRTFQHVKMVPDMTVLENVALGGYLRGRSGSVRAMLRMDRAEERQLLAEAERQLARIGMADRMHELAGNLALGPQRLMEIARALCSDPSLLLLDEPAAGLDLGGREDLVSTLSVLAMDEASPATVLVSHHVEEIPPGFTHAMLLRGGRVVASGPLEQVMTEEVVSTTFGMSLQLTHEDDRWSARRRVRHRVP
jgi:branched-chain amino acid transport system permease protein